MRFFCKGWATLRYASVLFNCINPDQPLLILRVKRKTAPRPLFRMFHQPLPHRIRVHIVQFFFPLRITPHIEVVKTPLPKAPVLRHGITTFQGKLALRTAPLPSSHRARYSLFQHLQDPRHVSTLGLADQQMHMLRHDDVSDQPKFTFLSSLFQHPEEQISRSNRFQIPPPVVTTEGYKM